MSTNPIASQLPAPTRFRVEGTVTAVHADGRFTLTLPDGVERAGTASGSQLNRLGKLLGRGVIVLGEETPDGSLAADGVIPAQGLFVIGSEDPDVSDSEQEVMNQRFRAAIGTWPGDETDEELLAMLKKMG